MASFAISFKSVHAVIVSCAKAKKNTKLLTRVKTELLQTLHQFKLTIKAGDGKSVSLTHLLLKVRRRTCLGDGVVFFVHMIDCI